MTHNAPFRYIIVLACIFLVTACKKKDDSSNKNLGYTGLKSITQYFNYTGSDTAFGAPVTWTLLYDGEKLLGADPDICKRQLGNIRLEYNNNNLATAITQLSINSTGDTLLYLRLRVYYDNSNRVGAVHVYRSDGKIYPFNFYYNNNILTSIADGYYNYNNELNFDTTSKVTCDNDGDIITMKAIGFNCTYKLDNKKNTLSGSRPVWLLQQLLAAGFDKTYFPVINNKKLSSELIHSSGSTYFSYNYEFDAKGNVTRRIRITPYTPIGYDSLSYTYY